MTNIFHCLTTMKNNWLNLNAIWVLEFMNICCQLSPPPQWSASSTDDKLTFLAGIFLNHVNNSRHENSVLAQSVANNTDNIKSNTTNIQVNTSDIQTLRKEATESEKKHEIVISGIPSCITQQLDLIVTAIFNKIGAHGLLNLICKIRLFKTPNQPLSNFTSATTNPSPLNPQNNLLNPPLLLQTLSNNPSISTEQQNSTTNSTYSIAVRVASRDALDTIIELKRDNKELKCSDVFSNQALSGLIYINEILPPYKYQLYKRTRSLAKTKGYKFTWIQSGNIYVRREKTSDRILIFSENDLNSLP